MASTYRTPGVYVQEISTLPGTVAEVQSAIPAFIGYTEKIRYDGRALQGIPERIASLKDFEERFGKSADVYLDAISISASERGRFSQVDSVSFKKRFLLYEAIYMYFINGGGECYVVSIGSFEDNKTKPYEADPFNNAIDSLNAVDEVTLLVAPEAVLLGESLYSVQQKMLAHCASRMSRFAIFDIKEEGKHNNTSKSTLLYWENDPKPDAWVQSYKEFRDRIGVMNLSYGAAYTPYIVGDTPTSFGYKDIKKHLVDSKNAKKLLLLADLDPESYEAVAHLDSAIQDMDYLLDAIRATKEKLLCGDMHDPTLPAISTETRPSNDHAEKPTLHDAVLKACGTDGADILPVSNVLANLLFALAPASTLTTKDPVAEAALKALLGNVANLKRAVTTLTEADGQELEREQALAAADACLANTDAAFTEAIKVVQAAITNMEGKEDDELSTAITALEASLTPLDELMAAKTTAETPASTSSAYALSKELTRYIRDRVTHLIPEIKDLCPPEIEMPTGDVLFVFQVLAGQVSKNNIAAFAKLLEPPLADDIYDTIKKNIARLSDGLFGTSAVYRSIHGALKNALRVQPPSASMAGLYAATDNSRGVWKAPANISISNCLSLTQSITAKTQEELNIDSVAGKSINALRNFPGKGSLVWGARTLDGNSQEWRYVPVRRFFIMVEESVRRATAASVFEPNDANLWSKVKALIDNYLLQKWKEGALMGAAAADAYFVNIGLGSTMTEQDILDGRLIVDIGMAVVRPAEFIILRFMHKTQQ